MSGGEIGVLVPSLSWTLLLDFAAERDSLSFAETLGGEMRVKSAKNYSFTNNDTGSPFSISINL